LKKKSILDEKIPNSKEFIKILDSYLVTYSKFARIKKLKLIVIILLFIVGLISTSYVVGDHYNVINLGIKNDSPTLYISANSLSGYRPFIVELSIQAYDIDGTISSFHLDFGDGTTYNDLSNYITHNYSLGTYTITAVLIDDMGATTKEELTVTINNILPEVDISSDVNSGKAPLTVNFYSYVSDSDGNINSYYWDFGDGETSDEINPLHIFDSPGTYTVTLNVVDNDGDSSKDSITIRTIGNTLPVAIASAENTTGIAPMRIYFNGLKSYDNDGKIVSYAWDFDDSWKYMGSSFGEISHFFESPGVYNVVLTVTDNEGGTDTDEIIITLT